MARARGSGLTRARAAIIALAALIAATPARAQRQTRRAPPRPEVRVDYLGPNPHVHAGAGVNVPVGTYLRVGLLGAGGAGWHDGRAFGSARADVIGRFTLDPFREQRWGLSAGGGLSARYDRDASRVRHRWRALVAVVVDLEGPRVGSLASALQAGFGGGARVGLVLRRSDAGRR
ncbi:MAG: hypothetical protein ABR499_13850 [Gemmatimonadaceae bacterium]